MSLQVNPGKLESESVALSPRTMNNYAWQGYEEGLHSKNCLCTLKKHSIWLYSYTLSYMCKDIVWTCDVGPQKDWQTSGAWVTAIWIYF